MIYSCKCFSTFTGQKTAVRRRDSTPHSLGVCIINERNLTLMKARFLKKPFDYLLYLLSYTPFFKLYACLILYS
jgi:hypothetical protein